MPAMDELKTAIAELNARLTEYLETQKADIDKKIADAIAADDAGEEVDLQALRDEVKAITARVPPKFEPSNN